MKKKVAYVINHISFFESHILPLALAAKKKDMISKFFVGRVAVRKWKLMLGMY